MSNSEEKLISVKDLNFKYHNEIILENISFDIIKGQNVAILGRNGGGKSTLIKVLLGFLKKNPEKSNFSLIKRKSAIFLKLENSMLLSLLIYSTLLYPGLQIKKIFSDVLTKMKRKNRKSFERIRNFSFKR